MTEEKQGGTAPDPEAIATDEDQAPESTVGAAAVADAPANDPTADAVDAQSAPAADDTADDTAGTAAAIASSSDEAAASATTDASVAADTPAADATEPSAVETTADTKDEPAEPAAVQTDAAATALEDAATDGAGRDEAAAAQEPTPEPAKPAPPRDLGPEPTTMEELLAEQDSEIKSFKHGDVVEGNVVRIDKDEILVDIGAKSEGVVSNRELYGRHAESQPQLNIGDTVLVYVLQPESQEGHAVLSLRRAGLERKWRSMQEQFEAGLIIEAPVIDHNKGGLIVDCGIRGFVPISQIVDFPRRPQNDQPRDAAQEIAEKLQPFVGRKLRLKILEVNRKANRLILSEKVALYEERREKRDELFSSLQVGQKVSGTVRSIAPFGVFIDLGGIDGLVHKSELSWNKVNNPEAGYKVGDEVEAEVIDINHERGRISLSIRRLQPDPWHSTVADFNVGDVIDGTVTKLVNFGAFVRVRDGLEGLIHISELSHQRVAHPGDVVHEGQQLKLKIISLDSERHRLGLSLKQAEEPPARPAPEAAPAAGGRAERRPRQERGYSMADAVQEPEGGIDNTLAAAFAQVREQVAASEEAAAEAEPAEAVAQAEEAVATAEPAQAVAEPAQAEPTEAAAQPAEAEQAEQAEQAEAVAEPGPPAAEPAEAVARRAGAVTEPAEAEPAEAVTEPAEAEPAEAVTEPAEPEPEPKPKAAAKAKAVEPVAEEPAEAAAASETLEEPAVAVEAVAEPEPEPTAEVAAGAGHASGAAETSQDEPAAEADAAAAEAQTEPSGSRS